MKPTIISALLILFLSKGFGQFKSYGIFKSGYYIDSSGNHISGLLKYNIGYDRFADHKYGDSRLIYKATIDADKIKFNSGLIMGFVINDDSFTVINNVHVFGSVYPKEFAQVLETGTIELFEYASVGGNGTSFNDVRVFILKKGPGQWEVIKKNFMEIMESCISDDAELMSLVKNKVLKYKDLREIVHRYNVFKTKENS